MNRTPALGAALLVTSLLATACGEDNRAPVAVDDSAVVDEDQTVVIAVLANDSDPDGDALRVNNAQVDGSGHSVRVTSAGLVVTPRPQFSGSLRVTYALTDGDAYVSGVATVTVRPVEDAPEARDSQVTVTPGIEAGIELDIREYDGDPITITVTRPPAGTLRPSGVRGFRYLPPPTAAVDSFQYEVSDGKSTASATVAITMSLGDNAPVAIETSAYTRGGRAVTIWLHGYDPAGAAVTAEIVTPPAHGEAALTEGLLAVYTPALDFVGTDTFQYRLRAGDRASLPATVTIQVDAADLPPVPVPATVTVAEDSALPIELWATDPEGRALYYSVSRQPQHGTLSGWAPSVTYRPHPERSGPDSFEFSVSDGISSATATVTIEVTAVDDAPLALPQSVSAVEDTARAVTLVGTDVDSANLTYAIAAQPRNGTLTGTPPAVVYLPAANFAGTDSFTFTVSDGTTTSPAATVSLTVASRPDAPTAHGADLTVAEDTSVAITLDGRDGDNDSLTYAIAAGPTRGTLQGSGRFVTYVPAANTSGADAFTFRVSDASASATAEVRIVVTAVDDAPTTADDVAVTAPGVTVAAEVLANDGDPEAEALTISDVTTAGTGTVAIEDDTIVYTPAAGFAGTEIVTYTVSDDDADGTARTATGTLRVGVGQYPATVPTAVVAAIGATSATRPDLSHDGRFVVLESAAALVADDTNNRADIYRLDRLTGELLRASVGDTGAQSNGHSNGGRISADGRFVVFASAASNLVTGDSNAVSDVFVRDLVEGRTVRVSVTGSGAQGTAASWAPDISADGQTIVFQSQAPELAPGDANGALDVFVHRRGDGSLTRVSVGPAGGESDAPSTAPTISDDGRVVAFVSTATNLVSGDGNGVGDVFVHVLAEARTERVSVSSTGGEANGASNQPSLSADGRFVGFVSTATNLAPDGTTTDAKVIVRDRDRSTTTLAYTTTGIQWAHIGADGRLITITHLNGTSIVRDRFAARTQPLHAPNALSVPVLSGNGSYAVGLSSTGLPPGRSGLHALVLPVTL
jgi:Tol biopolymer transport system component